MPSSRVLWLGTVRGLLEANDLRPLPVKQMEQFPQAEGRWQRATVAAAALRCSCVEHSNYGCWQHEQCLTKVHVGLG